MGVFVILFSLFFVGIGFYMKRHPEHISLYGYTFRPVEKRKNVDLRAVGNLFCKGFQIMAAAMIVVYFGLRLLGLPLNSTMFGFLSPMFLVTPVLLVMAQKHDKNPRSRRRYYLIAGIILSLFLTAVALYIFI